MTLAWPIWLRTTWGSLTLLITLVLALSSMGFYYLELKPGGEEGLLTALWWTVVTLTTVGYGDYTPKTDLGRLLGIVVMFCGIGLVSTLSGNLASLLVERQAKRRKGLLEVKVSGHIILLGWNTYGTNLVRAFRNTKFLGTAKLVIVCDLSEEARSELAFRLSLEEQLHFVFGNPAQSSVVARARPETARAVFILSQEGLDPKSADQQTIYSALAIRSLAPKVPVYGEVVMAENREHLLRAGVDDIVVRGELASHVLGLLGHNPSILPFIKSLLGMRGSGCLDFRQLTDEERKSTWGDLVGKVRGMDGILPLALCSSGRNLSLQDILDETSALDQFIMELFKMYGQKTDIGQQPSGVLINPQDSQSLGLYDGFLFLKAPEGQE